MLPHGSLSKFTTSAKHPGSTNRTENRHGSPGPSHDHVVGNGSAPHNAAAPPKVDPKILSEFRLVDTDRSGSITATELQTALRNGGWPSFEIDTVKLLMSMFDTNRNGTIDINEFEGLWKYIKAWESAFRRFDKNHNNTIDEDELQQALEQYGYKLSPQLLDLLKRKYDVNWTSGEAAGGGGPAATPPAGRSASSGISFDRFMRACVVVKQLKESFEALDRDAYGRVTINYDTFLTMVFGLP